jgi:hypothetical protein
MIVSAPLADAEIAPITPAGARPNHPFCRRLYAGARHFDFGCCVSPFLCLFNYPRHPGRHEHRGAIMGAVSLSKAASRGVRMLRRTMGPAITSNIVTPVTDIQDAYIARVMAAFQKVTPRTRGSQFGRPARAARKHALTRLNKRGYSTEAATQFIDDAHAVFLRDAAAVRGTSWPLSSSFVRISWSKEP